MQESPARFQRGISLYSFQEHYHRGNLGLDDCLAVASSMGVTGFEMLADQMLPGYPSITYNLGEDFVERWRGMLARHDLDPVALDVYGETKLYKHRARTPAELLDEMRALLKTAQVLGFGILRLTFHLPLTVVADLLPYAEEADIRLACEVHAPHLLGGEWVQSYLNLAARTGTRHLGLMPDLGTFCRHIPRVALDEALRDGATPRLIQYMAEAYAAGESTADMVARITGMGGNDTDLWMALRLAIRVWTYQPPAVLADYLPHVFHIHGKFYEMTADGVEPDIPYEEILRVLISGGYEGYIMSEYEGQRLTAGVDTGYDEIEQVQRHQALLARYL